MMLKMAQKDMLQKLLQKKLNLLVQELAMLLTLAMLLGRLEIYPILVLLSPRTWKR